MRPHSPTALKSTWFCACIKWASCCRNSCGSGCLSELQSTAWLTSSSSLSSQLRMCRHGLQNVLWDRKVALVCLVIASGGSCNFCTEVFTGTCCHMHSCLQLWGMRQRLRRRPDVLQRRLRGPKHRPKQLRGLQFPLQHHPRHADRRLHRRYAPIICLLVALHIEARP